jgi:hypothetical protein
MEHKPSRKFTTEVIESKTDGLVYQNGSHRPLLLIFLNLAYYSVLPDQHNRIPSNV